MPLKLSAAFKTDVGKQREQNEDNAYAYITEDKEKGLFIVADGMGGYQAGEVASQLAVQKISESLKSFFAPVYDQPTIKLSPIADQETIKLSPMQNGEPAAQGAVAEAHKTHKLSETLVAKNVEDQLKAAVRQANRAILSYGEEKSEARGLGCTVTFALVQDGHAYIANVGDSRT